MADHSARLGLPYIQGGQAQKHVTHNEALERLDLLVQLVVEAFDATNPPASPEEGQVWALGPAPTGAWAGEGGRLAGWSNGGWLFVAPRIGWLAVQGSTPRVWDGAAWVAVGTADLSDLPGVGVGTGWDSVNRLAVASQASLFTHAGAGHQLKLNKAASGDTGSILFQTGFSGRAEFGLAGTDDWSVKVSADGTTWHTALTAARSSGALKAPSGLTVDGALVLPALSVIGRSADTTGAVADIAATSDHQVLRRSGSAIGFGAVALNQTAAVTGQLPLANGGTGAASAAAARTNLGLGTAATAAVTTSATDATADRVLRTGASATVLSASPALRMTVGGTANAITLTSGAGLSGTPPTGLRLRFRAAAANTGAATLALDGGAPTACRTVTGVPLPAGYIRTDIETEATFDGTVWVLGREPEHGSNANGSFTRFADGALECWHSTVLSLTSTGAFHGGFRTARQTWTYPAAFAAPPVVQFGATSISAFGGAFGAPTTASVNWFAVTANSQGTAADRFASLLATGTWY